MSRGCLSTLLPVVLVDSTVLLPSPYFEVNPASSLKAGKYVLGWLVVTVPAEWLFFIEPSEYVKI